MKRLSDRKMLRVLSAFLAALMLFSIAGCQSGGESVDTSGGSGTDGTASSSAAETQKQEEPENAGFFPTFDDGTEYKDMIAKVEKYVENVLGSDTAPFSLLLDNKEVDIKTWKKTVNKEQTGDGTRFTAVYLDEKTGLRAELVGTAFSDFPTVDWVVNVKNTGKANSPVITRLYGCNIALGLPKDGDSYCVDTTQGCQPQGENDDEDFKLQTFRLLKSTYREFSPKEGRSSDEAWPFFDIKGKDCGVILAIGWSGQWMAKFTEINGKAVAASGMADLRTYLLPGEEIRTPSYSATYYEGDAEYGHNVFRRLILRHYTPKTNTQDVCKLPIAMTTMGGRTEASLKSMVTTAVRSKVRADALNVDAGWYTDVVPDATGYADLPFETWYNQVGNWSFNKRLFPSGNAKSLSSLAGKNGMLLSMWLEPERVMKGTDLYKKHRDLLFKNEAGDVCLLNLGKEEAQKWLVDYISSFIEENGLSIYRQDFNMTPRWFWQNEYADDRLGIAEIRYVEGLYKVFDTIREKYPNVLIDSCASGGRRIDIEILKRAIIMWRTDYCCNPLGETFHYEGSQFNMQSISYWLPLHATGVGTDDFEEYGFRSSLAAGLNMTTRISASQAGTASRLVEQAIKMRPYYYGDYYQILPPKFDYSSWQSYEVFRNDMNEGALLVFIRERSKKSEMTLCLKGLEPDTTYRVVNSDNEEDVTIAKGSELMENGIKVSGSPKNALVYYVSSNE